MTRQPNEGEPTPALDPPEFPPPIYNWLSLLGCALGIVSITAGIFFLLTGFATGGDSGKGGSDLSPPAGLDGAGGVHGDE